MQQALDVRDRYHAGISAHGLSAHVLASMLQVRTPQVVAAFN